MRNEYFRDPVCSRRTHPLCEYVAIHYSRLWRHLPLRLPDVTIGAYRLRILWLALSFMAPIPVLPLTVWRAASRST